MATPTKNQPQALRILFLGMAGATSSAVLSALLAAGAEVAGVVLAAGRLARATAPDPIAPIAPPLIRLASPSPTIADLAHARGIPAFELRRAAEPAALRALADLRPDLGCVACFPLRLPPELLTLPRLGFLNMHPALLPLHRGPEPLFWTLRDGDERAGVTIHHMDAGLDTGDIGLQAPLVLPDGTSGPAAERLSAALGGELMVAALRALQRGDLPRRPQPPGGGYQGAPQPGDWRIEPAWPARRAYNFMRGTAEWGERYPIAVGGAELHLAEALSFDPAGELPEPYVRAGGELLIQFAPGVLRAREA
jgi:methionyl-tRNA formyltransferase